MSRVHSASAAGAGVAAFLAAFLAAFFGAGAAFFGAAFLVALVGAAFLGGAFLAAFFVVGFGLFTDRVGDLTLAAELCPVERRSTIQAVLGFATGASLLLAGRVSGLIFEWTHSIAAVALAGGALSVISMVLLRRIPEPRHASLNQSVFSAPSVNDI